MLNAGIEFGFVSYIHIPNFCENSHIWMFVKIELLPIRCLFLKVK